MPSIKNRTSRNENISLDDVCNLISITTEQDELGQAIKTEKPFMVFCSQASLTRTERTSAGQLGHRPEFMLYVDADSYDNERFLEYQGVKYSIYKSFFRWDGFAELYCELKSNDK